MKYVFQLTNDEQLLIAERLVKKLRSRTQTESVVETLTNALNSRLVDLEDAIEVHFCDECGKLMVEGYCLGGGEDYYCSDECLHKNFSHEEFLAMYAGLDNTDPAEVERASKMSQSELDRLSNENDSQSYYTTWED